MKKTQLDVCPNCQTPFGEADNYCGNCGQKNVTHKTPFRIFVLEMLSSIFNVEAKYIYTVRDLFIPGLLTSEYNKLRRARYSHPLRFYFFISVIFFLALGYVSKKNIQALDYEIKQTVSPETFMSDKREGSITIGKGLTFDWEDDSSRQEFINLATLQPYTVDNIDTFLTARGIEFNWIQLQSTHFMVSIMSGRADYVSLYNKVLQNASRSLFFLMPFFALILKILYVRRHYYYSEHFIFALNFHSFLFLFLMLVFGIKIYLFDHDSLYFFPLFLLPYLFVSMKRVYQQSWGKTFVKFFMLLVMYIFLLFMAVGGTTFLTIIDW
ncbi:MAG: DUF3667 domain-containing protein [Bacteroidota bacterium]